MATGPDDLDGEDRRSFTDDRGEEWMFTRRRQVRSSDDESYIALVVHSALRARIVTCRREEWETARPDFGRLLARSVPAGGSRANPGPPRPNQVTPQNPSL